MPAFLGALFVRDCGGGKLDLKIGINCTTADHFRLIESSSQPNQSLAHHCTAIQDHIQADPS